MMGSAIRIKCLTVMAGITVLGSCGLESGAIETPASQFARAPVPLADSNLIMQIISAEDDRAGTEQELDLLRNSLGAPNPWIRQLTVRAVGRLERSELAELLIPSLHDVEPDVRAEAANALGQAVSRGGGSVAAGVLLERMREESHPVVLGAIAEALGRIRLESVDSMRSIETALVDASRRATGIALVGVARGLESWLRLNNRNLRPTGSTVERLYALASLRPGPDDYTVIRVRRLALAALIGGAFVDASLLRRSLEDRDVEVRRLAAVGVGMLLDDPAWDSIVAKAVDDEAPTVRYAALRVRGLRVRGASGCLRLAEAIDDPDEHVALLAIDLLGDRCARVDSAASLLEREVARLPTAKSDSWHRAAHGLVALAKVAPDRAAEALPSFVGHEVWWVRRYAATAAGILRAADELRALASDDQDNVREAAVTALADVLGHQADSIYVAQLARPDYQLVITASRALEGSPTPEMAVPALLNSLERITGEKKETSRDARRELLLRLEELAGRRQADYLASYLRDFDPAIAGETARVLQSWTGRHWVPAPQPLPRASLPSFGELLELEETRVVVELRGGGSLELRLLPFEAPTNVWRFVRLARAGYFDGLTFHRVVPGFVIQGGSPGANEYMGDGPYTRDELVRQSHLRGTVGVSTRGRDTGDGQIFINLVDNPRLDHEYTIFAEVVRGMDTVDRVLEGAVIERLELLEVHPPSHKPTLPAAAVLRSVRPDREHQVHHEIHVLSERVGDGGDDR